MSFWLHISGGAQLVGNKRLTFGSILHTECCDTPLLSRCVSLWQMGTGHDGKVRRSYPHGVGECVCDSELGASLMLSLI